MVTLVELPLGAVTARLAALLIAIQIAGCCPGVMMANLMFALNTINLRNHDRDSGAHWRGGVIATFGLLVVIDGVVRSGLPSPVAYAVGAYIPAAYWFTSGTNPTNPTNPVARMLSDTFAGTAPSSVPMFVLMELFGRAHGLLDVLVPYPRTSQLATDLTSRRRRSHQGRRALRLCPRQRPQRRPHHLTGTLAGDIVNSCSACSGPGGTVNPAVPTIPRSPPNGASAPLTTPPPC